MALIVLQSGAPALGQYDCKDAELSTFTGGEVCTLVPVTYLGSDMTAPDVNDGYTGTTSKTRPAVSKVLGGGERPLFLADDGIAGYGTLFGRVVTAMNPTGGSNLGPHTAAASGKITLHNMPGMYGVTVDSIDQTSGGVLPAGMAVGDPLYFTAAGKLTTSANKVGSAPVVARFVEFMASASLVSTPFSLVSALNSPSGPVPSLPGSGFTSIVIQWSGVQG